MTNYLKKGIMSLLVLYCCYTQNVSADEGHDHSHEEIITIGKKTFVHLQSILSTYQEVYHHLVRKD